MEEGNFEINVYIVVVYSNFIFYLFFLNEKKSLSKQWEKYNRDKGSCSQLSNINRNLVKCSVHGFLLKNKETFFLMLQDSDFVILTLTGLTT